MATIQDFYDYAKLATAVYVNMDRFPTFTPNQFANEANEQGRFPTAFAGKNGGPGPKCFAKERSLRLTSQLNPECSNNVAHHGKAH